MHDIAVRIVSGDAAAQGGLFGTVGSYLNDAVVGTILRSRRRRERTRGGRWLFPCGCCSCAWYTDWTGAGWL